jgi:hypothetical protein
MDPPLVNFKCVLERKIFIWAEFIRAGRPGLDSRQGQDVSHLHNVQTGYGPDPASYPMSTVGSFSGGKNLCKL